MRRYLAFGVLALAPLICAQGVCAQGLKLNTFEKLKDKASDSTDLTLSKDLLKMGAGFLGSDADAAKVKKLAAGLNGILIRSLEFEKEGAYTNADVQALIAEMGSPGWSLVISADEKSGSGHEISRVWIKGSENGELGGLRILSAEPKELSAIEILGRVRLEDLKDLGGLGVPDLNIGSHQGQSKGKKNNEEEELY
jgi:hypothetical protein